MMKKLTLFLVILLCATAIAQDPPVPEPAGQAPSAAEAAPVLTVVPAPDSAAIPDPNPEAETVAVPNPEPESESIAAFDPDSESESAAATEAEPVATSDADHESEPAATPEAESVAVPDPEPESEPVATPDPEPAPATRPKPTTPATPGKQTVAIYMAGKEPHEAKGVHSILGGELARTISTSEKYTGVDRTEAIQQQLAHEHTFQRSGAVDDDQIKSLGQQLGVQYLCISDINPVRGKQSYYLDVRLVDVVTAEIIRTTTANSSLKNADEMRRVARSIAYELIETEKAVEQRKRKKKAFFYTAISADVLGAGMLAYGLIENSNMKMYIDGTNFSDAERAQSKRNTAYIIGGVLLVSGVSIHILF